MNTLKRRMKVAAVAMCAALAATTVTPAAAQTQQPSYQGSLEQIGSLSLDTLALIAFSGWLSGCELFGRCTF